jgi:hypothetical protein
VRRPDGGGAWDALSKYAGTVEGPKDWSEEHDYYLYGGWKLSEVANTNKVKNGIY